MVGVTTAGDFVVKFSACGSAEQACPRQQRSPRPHMLLHWLLQTRVVYGMERSKVWHSIACLPAWSKGEVTVWQHAAKLPCRSRQSATHAVRVVALRRLPTSTHLGRRAFWGSSLDHHGQCCAWAQVDRGNVRAPPEVEEVYRGVAAPARKAVTEEATVGDMPKARQLQPNDAIAGILGNPLLQPACPRRRDYALVTGGLKHHSRAAAVLTESQCLSTHWGAQQARIDVGTT